MLSFLALLSSVSAGLPPPDAAPRADSIPYVVERGDTLDGIRHRYLLPGRNWRSLLGPARIQDEKRLPIGRRIDIPRSWLRFSVEPARLASYRGQVRLSRNDAVLPLKIGETIGEGVAFATGPNSFITLALADRSTVVIPSQSRGTVRRMRRLLLTGSIDYHIDIAEGRLETKVAPIDNDNGRYRIETPVSMTAVRGTEFRIAYSPQSGQAATELLAGTVSVSAPSGDRPIELAARFGASLSAGETARIEALLPAPDVRDSGRVQSEEQVHFQTLPVDGAARYRAVVATDAGFVDNLTEQFSDTGAFSFDGIPDGRQFIRVSALTAAGMEGFGQSYGFTRRHLSIEAEVSPNDGGYHFRWFSTGGRAPRYRFQLMADAADTVPLVDQVALTQETIVLHGLRPGIYYWRVGVTEIEDGQAAMTWTAPSKLTIGANGKHRGRTR